MLSLQSWRTTARSIDQAPSRAWSEGQAESPFLWFHSAFPHSVDNQAAWNYYSWLHAHTLSETAAHVTTGLWLALISETNSERAFINCSCFLWFTCRSFADIHCRIEIKFNIPSIFSVEKQAHFSCVTASAVNIFNNINYWLKHFRDLEKHAASSR